MSVKVVPFSAEHVGEAAALLAARHRGDRAWSPDLSPEYEDPAACLPIVQELFAAEGTSGVVAVCQGKVVGYLLGAPELGSPTHTFAGLMHPRSAEIAYAGHAAHPDDRASLCHRLYGALAQQWVADGLVGHYITVPANRDAMETWWDLGFGRFMALGVRKTSPSDEQGTQQTMNLKIRRATDADEEAIQALVTDMFRTIVEPPIFLPYLPETTAERRRLVAEHLADPSCPYWLAFAGKRLVAMQMFVEPDSSHWHQSQLQTPPRAVYLFLACTAPESRSSGIGAALFAQTMRWAREAGYDCCTAHFLTASRAAPFWRGLGFQPVSYWLHRAIDERATWARG